MDPETFESASVTFRWSQKVFPRPFHEMQMVSAGFSTPSSSLCKYLHFMEWSRETFHDHPKSGADT